MREGRRRGGLQKSSGTGAEIGRKLNFIAFSQVTISTEELNISFRIRPTFTKGNDVVKFQIFTGTTLHTPSLVALPDHHSHFLRNFSTLWPLFIRIHNHEAFR